jgi:hypothetical protein
VRHDVSSSRFALCHVIVCCATLHTEHADAMLCRGMHVMLQEVVQAPSCCPPEVLPLLSAAATAQQARDVDDALHLLELAEEAWRDHLQEQQPAQQHMQLGEKSCLGGWEGCQLLSWAAQLVMWSDLQEACSLPRVEHCVTCERSCFCTSR